MLVVLLMVMGFAKEGRTKRRTKDDVGDVVTVMKEGALRVTDSDGGGL